MNNQSSEPFTALVAYIKELLEKANPEVGADSFPIDKRSDAGRLLGLIDAAGLRPFIPGNYTISVGHAHVSVYKNKQDPKLRYWIHGIDFTPTMPGQSKVSDIRGVVSGLEGNPMPSRFELKEFNVSERLKVVCLKYDVALHQKRPYIVKYSFDGVDKENEEINYVETLELGCPSTRDFYYATFDQSEADKYFKKAKRAVSN
ncbi:MAG: hypothetical protein EOO88_59715 [Pedobacter sp.]|nr:MAG: hypothetical protein EOO88_59715 [Pedobacter sp.]